MSDYVRATNESKKVVMASRVKVAASSWARFKGLLGTDSLPAGEGMWLAPCRSIHMFFMRYSIDALFLNREGIVVYAKTLKPWTVSSWKPQAAGVLELPAGTLANTGTDIGDRISLT